MTKHLTLLEWLRIYRRLPNFFILYFTQSGFSEFFLKPAWIPHLQFLCIFSLLLESHVRDEFSVSALWLLNIIFPTSPAIDKGLKKLSVEIQALSLTQHDMTVSIDLYVPGCVSPLITTHFNTSNDFLLSRIYWISVRAVFAYFHFVIRVTALYNGVFIVTVSKYYNHYNLRT